MAKRRDPKEMRRLLARRRRRGLSWDELSEESGVPQSTLRWWQRRLREAEEERSGEARFVRLVATRAPEPKSPWPVEIVLGDGRRVVARPGFDIEHLRRVLEALRP
jgi:transcriptional regulator with XRE-family HTH domain